MGSLIIRLPILLLGNFSGDVGVSLIALLVKVPQKTLIRS